MAIITTPGAGVSPYQITDTDPTVLRAAANGATVLATADTGANTSVYIAGQAAVNSLITSNQPGVFAGANVNITLEEQNFNTTNQVTSTTNYAAGATGSIQYNNGANGFAGDAYFTYTNSNIITPGIRTDSYLLANGAPFLAGGNAAIGNFVFTGDNMTIAHANSTLSVTGNGTGNVNITTNGNTWAFNSDGNLTLPGNTFAVKYANGDPVVISGGATLPLANGTSNINIATANGNVTVTANGNTWTFGDNTILTLPGGPRIVPVGANLELQAAAGGYAEIITSDGNSYVAVTNSGAQIVTSGINTWNFDNVGNLILPGNTFAVNYANGNPVSIANTGNVTFSSEIVIGTGTSNLISGLYLAPSSSSANANMYLRVRGNIVDEPTHIHFDTGNNQYYNQFIGDDNKYIQLANTGNIVINSNDAAGNSAQWTFGTDGNLTIPGNIIGANVVSANVFTNLIGSGNVLIASSSNQTGPIATWTFDPVSNGTGNTVFPTGMHITSDGAGGTRMSQNSGTSNIGLRISAGNTNAFSSIGWSLDEIPGTGPVAAIAFNLPVSQNNAQIITGNFSATNYRWTFDNGGNLTLPNGAVINDTVGNAVAFGKTAGNTGQGISSVAIGYGAGLTDQGNQSVAIGENAGANQGSTAVAIGQNAGGGVAHQNDDAVAIGHSAGEENQGTQAIAIGLYTGQVAQGLNSIAIGGLAGQSAQGNNSIIINATGNTLNQTTANTFTVAPVRNDVANIAEIVFYNATSKEITYGNVISVAGNITGNYFLGNGSQLTSVAVPSQTILPTIQTITAVARSAGLFGAGQGGANVTVANTIPVTEYGVIITAGTVSETYKTGALGSLPGPVSLTFTTGLTSTQYTLFAYVTSNAGTYYSDAVTGTSGICLLAGTQIALSDGTHKAIEDITYTDKLLSWDFDRGCYAETTAMWIKRSETGSQYNLLTFSDGTTLRTFDQHRIFNKQAGAFTYPMTAETPVGTVTVNEHGQEITLTNKQVIQDTIEYYNVITDYHMNLFSDSVLTSCRFNNIYPIVDMKFAKDGRTLRTRAEFENVEDRFFHGLRLAEQTADIETVEWYVNRLLSTEVSTHAELAV